MKRQLRELEREAWGLNREAAKLRREFTQMRREDSAYVGTGSSVTFRDVPLVPKTYADEVE